MTTGEQKPAGIVIAGMKIFSRQKGLTLAEIMIAMAISLLVMGGAMKAVFSVQSAAGTIDQKTAVSVNARGAIYLLEENIRMMGFNPEGDLQPDQIVDKAGPGILRFKRNKDPDRPSETRTVTISLYSSDDSDLDGIADSGVSKLKIMNQPSADHIAALRFAYAFDQDRDGAIEVSDNGNPRWAFDSDEDGLLDTELETDENGIIKKNSAGEMTRRVSAGKIRAVRLWLVVRSPHPVRGSSEKRVFNLGGREYEPEDDDYSYSLFSTTIKCRNMS